MSDKTKLDVLRERMLDHVNGGLDMLCKMRPTIADAVTVVTSELVFYQDSGWQIRVNVAVDEAEIEAVKQKLAARDGSTVSGSVH